MRSGGGKPLTLRGDASMPTGDISGAGFRFVGFRDGMSRPIRLEDFRLPPLSFAFDHSVAPVGGSGGRCWLRAGAIRQSLWLRPVCRTYAPMTWAGRLAGRRSQPAWVAG